MMHSVHNRAIGEERRVATLHGVEEHRRAMDIEIRLLLTGKAGFRQVFRGGAAAHGHVAVRAVLRFQPPIRFRHSLNERCRQLGREDG
jgi:hypothetical protein